MRCKRPLLLIAHPGHELLVFGWLRQARPHIVVLTDKESAATRSSMDLTAQVAAEAGARLVPSEPFSESDLFEMLLRKDARPLSAFVDVLVDLMRKEDIDHIVTDAPEGYHAVHDLTSVLARAAIERHAARSGQAQVGQSEYHVVGDPRPAATREEIVCLRVDDATYNRKMEWLKSYAAELGPTVNAEVLCLLDIYGEDAYRHEVLGRSGVEPPRLFDGIRHYEKVGERLKSEQVIDQVLRHAEHMAAIEGELRAAFSPA